MLGPRWQTAAASVPANSFSAAEGSSTCTSCDDGKFTSGSEAANHDNVADFIECGGGEYWSTAGEGSCQDCEAGKKGSTSNNFGCDACGADSMSGTGASSCDSCSDGSEARSAAGDPVTSGATQCVDCEAGKSKSGSSCVVCAGNSIAAQVGQSTCATCENSLVSNEAKTVCVACGAGSYFSSGSCIGCNPGYIRPPGAADDADCTQCGENTYSNNNLCTSCDDGDVSVAGSSRLEDCRLADYVDPCHANTFQENTPLTLNIADCECRTGFGDYGTTPDTDADPGNRCPACALGFYRGGYSRDACSPCEDHLSGSITLATQRTSPSDCVCRTTFAKNDTANECQCPAGKGLVANGDGTDDTCESCAENFYKASSGNVECTNCGAHFTTGGPGAIAQSNCECKTTFILNSAACKCAAGLKYSAASKLCVLCEPGKFSDAIALNEECTSCAAGTYPTDVSGSESCTSCGEGKYSTTVGATYSSTCLNCPLGKWSESVGAGE